MLLSWWWGCCPCNVCLVIIEPGSVTAELAADLLMGIFCQLSGERTVGRVRFPKLEGMKRYFLCSIASTQNYSTLPLSALTRGGVCSVQCGGSDRCRSGSPPPPAGYRSSPPRSRSCERSRCSGIIRYWAESAANILLRITHNCQSPVKKYMKSSHLSLKEHLKCNKEGIGRCRISHLHKHNRIFMFCLEPHVLSDDH